MYISISLIFAVPLNIDSTYLWAPSHLHHGLCSAQAEVSLCCSCIFCFQVFEQSFLDNIWWCGVELATINSLHWAQSPTNFSQKKLNDTLCSNISIMSTQKKSQNSCKAYCNPPRKKISRTKWEKNSQTPEDPNRFSKPHEPGNQKRFRWRLGGSNQFYIVPNRSANPERFVASRERENISHPNRWEGNGKPHQLKSAEFDQVEIPVIRNPGGYND